MHDNPSQRPQIDVPRTLPDYILEFVSIAGIAGGAVLMTIIWTDLPDQIPRHFGITGEPTAWSGRWSAILPLVIALAIYVGLTVLNRYPHAFNYAWPITRQNAAIQYRLARSMITWLKAICVWMMIAIVWSQARVALGDSSGINPLMIVGTLVGIHVVLGVFLYRMYQWRDGSPDENPSISRR